jgi:uncharacterized protein YbaR (Trm112 family)
MIEVVTPVRCPTDHTVLAYADAKGIKLVCPRCRRNYRHPEK